MTAEFYQGHLHGARVTLVQFKDHVQTEDEIKYLMFYTHNCLQTLSDELEDKNI